MRRNRWREEFEQFASGSTDGLLRTANLVVWDQAGAEDLVQECLLEVARRWPRVRSMEHPAAYARRILINRALDASERYKRHRAELVEETAERHDEAAATAFNTVDTAQELIGALGTLTTRQRAVLVLRYFDDLTEVQTAEILSCSVGTVKSTASRALERMREALDQSSGQDDEEEVPRQEIKMNGVEHEPVLGI